jgi:hypothetical protein
MDKNVIQNILNTSDTLTSRQFDYLNSYLSNSSYRKIAQEFGVNESTVRRSIKAVLRAYYEKSSNVPEHMNDPIPDPLTIKGTSTMYDQDGKRRMHWVKTQRDQSDIYNDLKLAMTDLAQELPQMKPKERSSDEVDPNLLTVYPIGDPHIGLLCYTPEVGQDWDLKIAESVFLPLFHNLVTVAPSSDECLLVDLGDFWHYDGMEQQTMRSGHKVDADGRPSKMVQVGYRIMRQMIESALTVHNIVNVVILPGNHDDLGSIFLRVSLEHIYENEPRVRINPTPNVFQYFSWGQNLIGMHHGDKCKMPQLPMVMAADQPELWGSSKFRKWLIGHFHNDSSHIFNGKELQGCTAETFRTIIGTEGYAHEAGYRSDQDGKAIVFHKDYGEIERYTVNISQIR